MRLGYRCRKQRKAKVSMLLGVMMGASVYRQKPKLTAATHCTAKMNGVQSCQCSIIALLPAMLRARSSSSCNVVGTCSCRHGLIQQIATSSDSQRHIWCLCVPHIVECPLGDCEMNSPVACRKLQHSQCTVSVIYQQACQTCSCNMAHQPFHMLWNRPDQ